MKRRFLLFLCLSMGIVNAIFAQERYVKPIDEAKNDPSFHAFRTKLIDAVKKHDEKHIYGILDRNITNSFGGDGGIAEFKKRWNLGSAKSEFWKEFLVVITNGGTFSKERGSAKQFWAPYTFNSFPADLDTFEYEAIFGNNVNLRVKPATDASVLATLSYNVIKTDYENSVKLPLSEDQYDWLKIETLGGKKGYVMAEYVRSPIDYRAGFEKKGVLWKMTSFITGD